MRDDNVLDGFTEMREEPVDSRITKNSASWKRNLERFIASEVKRIKKTYQSREECMKDYTSAYWSAYRHYRESIKVMKRGDTLILERKDL